MIQPVGFWSYTRHDDAHSDGQLSQLRVIVGKAIGLQLGAEVTLWQDVTAIPYGADWSETIEQTLSKTTFFMPIVTPRFLRSENCLKEYQAFRKRMSELERNDLVFPVHYVSIENLRNEDSVFGDELSTLRRHQWIDFRPLFYADPKASEVRRWAGDLAANILEALSRPTPHKSRHVEPEKYSAKKEHERENAKDHEPPVSPTELMLTELSAVVTDSLRRKAEKQGSNFKHPDPSEANKTEAAPPPRHLPPDCSTETADDKSRGLAYAWREKYLKVVDRPFRLVLGCAALSIITIAIVALTLHRSEAPNASNVSYNAVDKYKAAAASGDKKAIMILGSLYSTGQFVQQDFAEAHRWFERGAALGDPFALTAEGVLYAEGKGVPQNFIKAREEWEKAANSGDALAMNNLGSLYYSGHGVAQDYPKAREWWEKSAASGDAGAMAGLGLLFLNGQGVQQDFAIAHEWYEKAAAGGNIGAMTILGTLYENGVGGEQDYIRAAEWWEKATIAGDSRAMKYLGDLNARGQGVPQDYVKAREWYEKAAAAGNTDAMNSLSNLYTKGQGVPQDMAKAQLWSEKASAASSASR